MLPLNLIMSSGPSSSRSVYSAPPTLMNGMNTDSMEAYTQQHPLTWGEQSQALDSSSTPAIQSQNLIAHSRNNSIAGPESTRELQDHVQRSNSCPLDQIQHAHTLPAQSVDNRDVVETDPCASRVPTSSFVPSRSAAETSSSDLSHTEAASRSSRVSSAAVSPRQKTIDTVEQRAEDRKSSEISLGSIGDVEHHDQIQAFGLSSAVGYSPLQTSRVCLCQPEPKIPRPRNAFILYRQRHQQAIVARTPGVANPDISKIAGAAWREEPEEVKKQWKKLAEEEKARHALRYPNYRFQPRTKRDRGSESLSPTRLDCTRCGGRSIGTPSPHATLPQNPFQPPTPHTAINGIKGMHLATPEHTPPAIDSAGRPISSLNMAGDAANRRQFNPYPPGAAPNAPFIQTPVSGTMSRSASIVTAEYPSQIRRGSVAQHMIVPQTAVPQHARSSPRMVVQGPLSARAASLSVVTDHTQGNIVGYTQRAAPMMMAPPPPRPRSSVHVHTGTPITTRAPGFPPNAHLAHPQTHMRNGSEAYRLPPLPSPGHPMTVAGPRTAHIRNGSIGFPANPLHTPMRTLSISETRRPQDFVSRVQLLRRVAVPLSVKSAQPTAVSSAQNTPIRGAVIALEGDDWQSVASAKIEIVDALNRTGDFFVHVWQGPALPADGADYAKFHSVVGEWLARRSAIEQFLRGGAHLSEDAPKADANTQMGQSRDAYEVDVKPNTDAIAQESSDDDDLPLRQRRRADITESQTPTTPSRPIYAQKNRPAPHDDENRGRSRDQSSQGFLSVNGHRNSMSDRIRRLSASPSADRSAKRQKTVMTADGDKVPAFATPTPTTASPWTLPSVPAGKIPLLLISHYLLSASNAWASAISITDSYQVSDHWQWIATLWRGVVGADFTVYIQGQDATVPSTPGFAPAEGAGQGSVVDVKEDLGLICVRGGDGGVAIENKAVRRVAFEIGEWVRGLGGREEMS